MNDRTKPPPTTVEIVPVARETALGRPFAQLTPEETQHARDLIQASKASNTVRGYKADWEDFVAWCKERGVNYTPPVSPDAVAQYLTVRSKVLKPATLGRRLAGINWAHKTFQVATGAAAITSPTRDPRVLAVMEGIRRTYDTRPDSKAAIDREMLRAMVATLDLGTLAGMRDRALLMMGFFGAFRRSEFIAVKCEDLVWRPEYVLVRLGKTKTDQTGEKKQEVPLTKSPDSTLCPVTALSEWLRMAGIKSGYVFRGFFLTGAMRPGHLDAGHVNDVVKKTIQAAKLGDPAKFGAHSLRAGFVTQSFRDGATADQIRRVTRHESIETLWGYQREADPLAASAATSIHGDPTSGVKTEINRVRKRIAALRKQIEDWTGRGWNVSNLRIELKEAKAELAAMRGGK